MAIQTPGSGTGFISDPQDVSVVYFHGMGNQRRFQETGDLVGALDTFCYFHPNDTYGIIKLDSSIQREQSFYSGLDENVSFIKVEPVLEGGNNVREGDFRFYEVYWAPFVANEVPVREVISWFGGSIFRSLAAPFQGGWRSRSTLRRIALFELTRESGKQGIPRVVAEELEKDYTEFLEEGTRKNNTRGSYKFGFLRYVKNKHRFSSKSFTRPKRPIAKSVYLASRLKRVRYNPVKYFRDGKKDTYSQYVAATRKWRKKFRSTERRNSTYIISLFFLLAISVASLLWSVVLTVSNYSVSVRFWLYQQNIAKEFQHFDGTNVGIIVVGVVILFSLRRFLRKYVGDVQYWGTYEETNTKYSIRKKILEHGVSTLRHVLARPGCSRVIVIAHSLGSSIAYDSLLETARQLKVEPLNRSKYEKQLEKLGTFITVGSPIDKIHYFFESHRGHCSRTDILQDKIRGSIGSPPFTLGSKENMPWVNYYDAGDIISSSIESALKFNNYNLHIDNVVVANSYCFPHPGKSHTGYFNCRQTVKDVFGTIFNSGSPRTAHSIPKYVTTAFKNTKADYSLAIVTLWLLLGIAVADIINIAALPRLVLRMIFGYLAFGILLWLGTRAILSTVVGHLDPLVRSNQKQDTESQPKAKRWWFFEPRFKKK